MYREVHVLLRSYIQKLANHVRRESNREVVVFIDTNPALSIYTHIALVAMSELIIPVNADCFSMEVKAYGHGRPSRHVQCCTP